MTCNDIIKYFEEWAPKEIAWQKDNVGLQVGSINQKLKNILLCLELTNRVIDDAIKKNCNLIISHHPLLFHPLKKIDLQKDKNSKLIEKLIKNDITLYSAHTNLDFTKDGVSFELAKKLKLRKIDFLVHQNSNQFKLAVFVPMNYVDKVADAIFKNGGGQIGEYSNCSFRTKGEGTFKGSRKTNPFLGTKGNVEKTDEIKLEVLVDAWKLKKILSAIIEVHPYEEVAYDIYPLENPNTNFGAGAIGELDQSISQTQFLEYVSDHLKIKNFRYSKGKNKIKKVALCGGAGGEMLKDAIYYGVDAFITADLKYHTFHDADGEILLIDAGHYETEIHSLDEVKRKLNHFITEKNFDTKIFKYDGSTNPIFFYNK
ncbi:MAG: Nif3-like dinuclear metal center hexameric protein [Bacteroidetes bacterium]|nr:Nif3-like dinuclear metal center hexameric protein [Bacteroidota bacterium]